MKKNGFLRKCIIIVLSTVVFPLSVSFFKSVGIHTVDDGGRAILKRDWLKSGDEVGYTSGSVSCSVKVCT